MDTKKDSAASDVPTFKVARVGKDRKRKGGALSFLRGGGARGTWSGATGGAGAGAGGGSSVASMFASSFAKTMLSIMLASGIGAAAIGVGYMNSNGKGDKPEKKPEVFQPKADVKIEGDTSNLPGNSNSIPNSMGYVTGSRDGLTPEERAAKEAEAARLAAEEEAKRKAEEEAAAKANAVDPNAIMAEAKKDGGNNNDKGSAFGKKFGQLSSSMGGSAGLAGGSGMSGGVGRSFGGMGSIGKGASGKISGPGTVARPTMSKTASSKVAASNVKGFARKQLANANALSRRGMSASRGESAAYDASSAFDNNQGAGTVISGAGIGKGTKGQSAEDGGGQNGNTDSQPVNSPQQECSSNQVLDPNSGTCKEIAPPPDKDDTKNAWMFKVAQGIMVALTVISALAIASHSIDWLADAGEAIRGALRVIVGVLGAILCALGLAMIATTGDKLAGAVFAFVGGYTAAMMYNLEGSSGTIAQLSAVNFVVPILLGGFAAAMGPSKGGSGH